MIKISSQLFKIANNLDDLELHKFAENVENIAKCLIAESEMTPIPSKQPQIQSEPIQQILKNKIRSTKNNFDKTKEIKIEKEIK